MPITSNDQRGLLIVNGLVRHGKDNLESLYKFLEISGVQLAANTLRPFYGTMFILEGEDVTFLNFMDRLDALTAISGMEEVDVILSLHGLPGLLYFENPRNVGSEVASEIRELGRADRLRLFYSTACYGSSHAPFLVNAGFTVATGAIGINANSPVEYPVFLSSWAQGLSVTRSLRRGNSTWVNSAFDAIASTQFPRDVCNSRKLIFGDERISINATRS